MGKRDSVCRFVVGSPDGTYGAVWRIWLRPDDDSVYVSSRESGGQFKVSLHPGQHLAGPTSPEVERLRLAGRVAPRRSVWDPPADKHPGYTRLYMLVEPMSEVVYRIPQTDGSKLCWVPPGPDGSAIEFQVWRVPAEALPFRTSSCDSLWTAPMANGEAVCLLWRTVDFNTPDLISQVQRYRREAASHPEFVAQRRPDRQYGTLVDAVFNPTGESFLLHVAL